MVFNRLEKAKLSPYEEARNTMTEMNESNSGTNGGTSGNNVSNVGKTCNVLLRFASLPEDQNWNPTETANANYSFNIRERRLLYRILDCIGLFLRLRRVPRECAIEECSTRSPSIKNVDDDTTNTSVEVWKTYFSEAMGLVKHDDGLNWQKFHYLLLIMAGLISAFVFSHKSDHDLADMRLILCTVGILLSWGADLTFQEGLRCLRAHRRELQALDRKAPPFGESFILHNNPYNQRDVLELGPLVMAVLFIGLIIFTWNSEPIENVRTAEKSGALINNKKNDLETASTQNRNAFDKKEGTTNQNDGRRIDSTKGELPNEPTVDTKQNEEKPISRKKAPENFLPPNSTIKTPKFKDMKRP